MKRITKNKRSHTERSAGSLGLLSGFEVENV
jgi:hypothetical protein